MQVEFLSRFNKDVDALSDDKVKTSLLKIIEEVEKANSIRQLSNVKKLIGYKTAYRLKMGEYRIGFFFENSVFQFARFVHRKDIYKVFP